MLVAVDPVFGLRGSMDLVQAIRLLLHHFGREFFREKDLTDVRSVSRLIGLLIGMSAHAHLEVDVVSPSHIVTGKHSLKIHHAMGIADLDSAAKGEGVGRVIFGRRSHSLGRTGTVAGMLRIKARRRSTRAHWILFRKTGVQARSVAMPDIHGNIRHRLAGMRVHHHDAERERNSWLALDDVGAE
jgi:hypothetical protein